MDKISLVIADVNEVYIENIMSYISLNHSNKFQLQTFSKKEPLEDYLNNVSKVDILLMSPEFKINCDKYDNIKFIFTLSNAQTGLIDGVYNINKFQHVDSIVSDIISLYADKNDSEVLLSGDKKTKIIAVFSPIGGSGKTSIAISLCINSTLRGKKAFYLNLESFQSTSIYFNETKDINLSRIIYYLKEKPKNLTLKIEGALIKDINTKVDYFSPPDNSLEMEELNDNDIRTLMSYFRVLGKYDYIIIDMESEFTAKNIAVFEDCNELLTIFDHSENSIVKARKFINDIHLFKERMGLDLSKKIKIVLNKYKNKYNHPIEEINLDDKQMQYKVPFDKELNNGDVNKLYSNDSGIKSVIDSILDRY